MSETIEALVDGGKASAGPPLGPALGPLGINIMDVLKVINEKTKAFEGMKVPIKLTIDPKTKEFEVEVGTPPATALILQEAGIEKGAGNPRTGHAGNLTMDQVIKIVKMKGDSLPGRNLKNNAMAIIGTCVSMGVYIDGKKAKEAQDLIRDGAYDKQLKD